MALVERLAILITGDATGAINALKDVSASAEKNATKADASASKFSGSATKIGAGMMAAGAGLLSVGIAAANTTTDLGREVLKLQRYTGMNAESASKLAYAAKQSGVDVDSLSLGIGKLSKAMADSPEKLGKLGVEAKTSDGHLRAMTDVLGDVAEKFKTMGPGTASTAAALDLFGRSGTNLLPFLLKGRDGIAELSNEAEKMGLVLSQDNVDAVKANIVAQRKLGAAVDGVKVQIGNQMLPILTKFTELMTNLPGPIKDVAGPIVVLSGAVLVAGGAFLLMAGQVQKAKTAYQNMGTTAQTTTNMLGLAAAAITVATTAYTVMQGAVDRARSAQQKANDGVLAAAANGGYASLSAQLTQTHDANVKLYNSLDLWKTLTRWDPWNAFSDAGKMQGLDKLDEQLGIARASAIALSDSQHISLDTATVWLAKMAEGGTIFPTVEAAVAAYTGKVDANKVGTEEAATAQDTYATAIKHAADVLRGTTDPIFAVMNAQDSLAEAQANYDRIKNDGTKTDAEKEAALRKLWSASFDLTDAQSKLGGALASGDVSSAKLGAALDTLRLNNIDPTTKAGRALTEKIYGVDETAKIVAELLKTRVLRAETDETNLNAFLAKLAEIKRKHIEVQNWIFTHDLGSKGNGLGILLPPAASGGYVPGGGARLVGEHGPELFVPSSAGSVINALSTEHAMSGGGGGVVVQNLNVTLPNVTNGDQLVDELQRYIRRNGPLPLAVA
jgi:hypothetical protein